MRPYSECDRWDIVHMLPCFPLPVVYYTLTRMCLFHGSSPELCPSLPCPFLGHSPPDLLYPHAEWSPRPDSLAPHSSAHRHPAIPLSLALYTTTQSVLALDWDDALHNPAPLSNRARGRGAGPLRP